MALKKGIYWIAGKQKMYSFCIETNTHQYEANDVFRKQPHRGDSSQ